MKWSPPSAPRPTPRRARRPSGSARGRRVARGCTAAAAAPRRARRRAGRASGPRPSGSTSSTAPSPCDAASRGEQSLAGPQPARRVARAPPRRPSPSALEQEHLDRAARLPSQREACRDDPRVVDDDELPARARAADLDERAVADVCRSRGRRRAGETRRGGPPVAGRSARAGARSRARRTSSSAESILAEWTNRHWSEHASGSPKRATDGVTPGAGSMRRSNAPAPRSMRLARSRTSSRSQLPKQVGTAVRDGIAREVVPVSRSLAEIRGRREPGAAAARAARAGAPRGAERPDRGLRRARRPRVGGVERCRPAAPPPRGGHRGRGRAAAGRTGGVAAVRHRSGGVEPEPSARGSVEREDRGARGRPDGDGREQRHVLDEERLGLLAEAPAVEQQQVAEEPVDDERDRRDEPARVVRGQRVGGVGGDRRGGDDREQLVDERRRCTPRATSGARDALEPELGAPLAEGDEQREQEGAEQEPVRDADVDRDRARRRAQRRTALRSSARRRARARFKPQRVRGLERDEAGEAGQRAQARARRRASERDREQRRREREGVRGASSPRAIGRERLTGCSRSAATSRTSLTRYAALDAAQ